MSRKQNITNPIFPIFVKTTSSVMRLLAVFFLCLLGNQVAAQRANTAEIYGKVAAPLTEKKIKAGHLYNADGSKVMHSNDPMAMPPRNIVLSFTPLSFTANLQPTEGASITQREQTFIPMLLPVVTGSTIYFLNEDEFFHNIYSLTPGSRFNIGRRPPGSPYPIKIKKEGIIKLSCDIHPHMEGFILSLSTPYFTRVDGGGNYRMANLPAGRYRVEVHHPYLDKITKEIDLIAGDSLKRDFDFQKNTKP